MNLPRKFLFIFDRTLDLLAIFAAFIIAYLVLAVAVGVILREFRIAVLWMFEITEYSMVWITFLATAWVLREEGHTKMDLLLTHLNPRNQAILNIISSILGTLACLIVTLFGIKATWASFQTGYFLGHTPLKPPLWPILIIIPVGGFLLFIQFLRRTYQYIRSYASS